MNLKELDSFKMADAITFHDELNPKLWNNNHLRPEVREQLILIAEDFLSELGISDVDVEDITVSGSNAAYSYTPHSDLDLHLLVDMSRYDDDIYKEFFNAKKALYNEAHNIKIHGVPVEVYVQDSREPVVSLGEYSVLQNKWLKFPTKRRANFDQTTTQAKYNTLKELIELALKSTDLKKVNKILGKIKQYRQAGLDKGGEFGPENLAYKALRSQGLITKLYDLRDKLHSEILTIETMYQNPEEMVEEEEKTELPPKVYHVTPASNLDSIMKAGLRPQVGARSSQIPGEQSAIYCFPDKTSLEDAMMNWLGDEFDEDEELALLEIDTTNLTGEYSPNAEFEIAITSLIPPNRIKVLSSNLVTITESTDSALNEIGYADALGQLNMPDSKIISSSTQDGTISQKPVMKFEKGNTTIYFFTNDDKISALVLLADGNKLRAIKNFSGQPGQVFALLNHIVNINSTRLAITPDEPLTKEGFQWIAKLIKNPSGLNVSDLDGNPIDINALKTEWEKAKSTRGTESGTTGIIISESSAQWKSKLQENEYRIMPYIYFNVENLHEASGYIPSEKEKNDPRFKTALTVDVKPDAVKKNAKAFNMYTSRAGIPPTARPDGKF